MKKITPLQRLINMLKLDGKEIRDVYAYAVFNGLINLSLPLGIQAIINLIQGGQVSTSWILLVVFVVAGVAASGVLQILQMRITENLQQKIFARAAFDFAYRIPKIKSTVINNYFPPELVNRFFDILTVQKGLSKILIDISSATLQILFGLILLSFYHPFFILFSFILVFLVYAIFKITAKRGLETSLTESKHKYRVAHWLEEVARTVVTFKIAGKTHLSLHRVDAHVEDYLKARDSHFKILVQQFSMMVVFKVIVATGLLAIGGILVMEQMMNIGQFVAAEIIILLVMGSVEKLIVGLETIYDVLTGVEKIGQVTDLELENGDGIDLKAECTAEGMEIDLNEVYFQYPGYNYDVIKNLNAKIEKGEILSIVGENKSGKSTLIHLLAAMYDVGGGTISYNGFPKNNLDIHSLRAVIGGSLIEDELFDGSLLENIAVGRDDATFENVKWAIHKMGLDDFVKSLPKGYDTLLEPLGKKIPKSIVQKIKLARAIADKPKLLLLEYSFEYLNKDDRNRIIDFLCSGEVKWTVIVVSSDTYMLQKAHRIAYMKNGKFEKMGTWDEMKTLISQN